MVYLFLRALFALHVQLPFLNFIPGTPEPVNQHLYTLTHTKIHKNVHRYTCMHAHACIQVCVSGYVCADVGEYIGYTAPIKQPKTSNSRYIFFFHIILWSSPGNLRSRSYSIRYCRISSIDLNCFHFLFSNPLRTIEFSKMKEIFYIFTLHCGSH